MRRNAKISSQWIEATRQSLVESPEGMSPEEAFTIYHSPFTILYYLCSIISTLI
jgi:hypothetical protein